jgi:hypothetical protein
MLPLADDDGGLARVPLLDLLDEREFTIALCSYGVVASVEFKESGGFGGETRRQNKK